MMKKFIQLLRYAIDTQQEMPQIAESEWSVVFDMAQRHNLVGLLFDKMEQLRVNNIGMSQDLLLEWFSIAEQIRLFNGQANKQCVMVCKEYREAGFDCCVLKGQGNAVMYDKPELRAPGDIDVWVVSQTENGKVLDFKKNMQKIVEYVQANKGKCKLRYYHVEYEEKGTLIEAHFIPGIMNNPWYNRKLQRWYREWQKEQMQHNIELPSGVGQIAVPTIEFNIVYQLAHLMHHFFDEGIGLRHLVDYYYLLKTFHAGNPSRLSYTSSWEKVLQELGLRKFAGAVMWGLREVLNMEEELMIVPVDEWRGRTLMNEMMRGGNLGKYSGLAGHTTGSKYFLKHWRNLHFVRQYPAEALCEPIFRTWHFFWRLRMRSLVA